MRLFSSRAPFVLWSLLLGLFAIQRAWPSAFQLSPTQIFLSANSPSALLTLKNQDTVALRFQLSVFGWDQSPKGEVVLNPTEDIVFFPPLLTLAPGEERRVRIGRATPIASSEKAYRIFIEELPPPEKQKGSEEAFQVRLLSKTGVPIFLRPDQQVVEGRVEELAIRQGLFLFQIKNSGNIHFVPLEIIVRGLGAVGETLVERNLEGWYILAGGLREYELELPKQDCARIKALVVQVQAGKIAFREKIEVPPDACGR